MNLTIKASTIEAGRPVVIVNVEDAKDIGVYVSDRVEVSREGKHTVALIDTTISLVEEGRVLVSKEVEQALSAKEGDSIEIRATKRPVSVEYVRKKIKGEKLTDSELKSIVEDIVTNELSDVELSAFVTAAYINGYTLDEIVGLTNAMVDTGQSIDFGDDIVDKHCIGGVAGNRTTMLIVPIIAAAGLTIPKTSSRAITSPAGTADTMEVLANVEFEVEDLKEIVKKTGGCLIWGGALNLAPADDKIIRVEYPLSIDPEGHVMSSVMAKKKSVGSDYVLIDIPVGKGAKISDREVASSMAKKFIEVGKRLGMNVECLITDGNAPIGKGIGPALEARDCLLALENKGPLDLVNKSLDLAGILLELSGKVPKRTGRDVAEKLLVSGRAREKMMEIIEAQGGNPRVRPEDVVLGSKKYVVESDNKGNIRHIDSRRISAIARAAGAPKDKGAGVDLHVEVGDCVKSKDPLFTIYSDSARKLEEAVTLARKCPAMIIGGVILDTITCE